MSKFFAASLIILDPTLLFSHMYLAKFLELQQNRSSRIHEHRLQYYNLWKTRQNLYDISDKFAVFHVITVNLDPFKALYAFCKGILFKNSFSLKNLLFFFSNKSLRDPLRRETNKRIDSPRFSFRVKKFQFKRIWRNFLIRNIFIYGEVTSTRCYSYLAVLLTDIKLFRMVETAGNVVVLSRENNCSRSSRIIVNQVERTPTKTNTRGKRDAGRDTHTRSSGCKHAVSSAPFVRRREKARPIQTEEFRTCSVPS